MRLIYFDPTAGAPNTTCRCYPNIHTELLNNHFMSSTATQQPTRLRTTRTPVLPDLSRSCAGLSFYNPQSIILWLLKIRHDKIDSTGTRMSVSTNTRQGHPMDTRVNVHGPPPMRPAADLCLDASVDVRRRRPCTSVSTDDEKAKNDVHNKKQSPRGAAQQSYRAQTTKLSAVVLMFSYSNNVRRVLRCFRKTQLTCFFLSFGVKSPSGGKLGANILTCLEGKFQHDDQQHRRDFTTDVNSMTATEGADPEALITNVWNQGVAFARLVHISFHDYIAPPYGPLRLQPEMGARWTLANIEDMLQNVYKSRSLVQQQKHSRPTR